MKHYTHLAPKVKRRLSNVNSVYFVQILHVTLIQLLYFGMTEQISVKIYVYSGNLKNSQIGNNCRLVLHMI